MLCGCRLARAAWAACPSPARQERLGLNDAVLARREIERNDAAHSGTMHRLFGIDWGSPSLYAIVLNTARVPVADCVDHIVRLTQSPAFEETTSSRANGDHTGLAVHEHRLLEAVSG